MRSSHLYRSQPRSKKSSANKKIQPLFKKQFNIEESNISHAQDKTYTETIEQNKISYNSLSENSINRPGSTDTKFKIRNIYGVKSETSANVTSPTDSTAPVEELQQLMQKLKCERLEILKDLWTYESRYLDKLSIRARLQEIRNNCLELQTRLKATRNSITAQKDVLQFLESSLKTITHNKQTKCQDRKFEFEVPVDSFKYLVHISGLLCLVSVKVDSELSEFTVHLYPPASCPTLTTQIAVNYLDTNLSKETRFIRNSIRKHILTNISLTYQNAKLSINTSGRKDFKVFYAKIRGWVGPVAPIVLNQLESEYEITLQDHRVPLKLVVYEPRFNEFFPIVTLPSFKLSQLSSFMHENLRVIRSNNQLTLEWGSTNLESTFTKTKLRPQFDQKAEEVSLFEQMNELVTVGEIMLDDMCAYIEIRKNMLLDKMRISVYFEGLQLNYKQEDHENLFRIYLSLQNLRYTRQIKTFLNSLELNSLVKRLLKL